MKRSFLLCLMLTYGSFSFLSAQRINLPRVSPKASVSYTIGLTDVTLTYGAPAVKERIIWGDVVPYGEIWRAGANEATTVEFTTDVNMEGQTLRAGKYALFMIPGETEWTVIFNKKHDQWGASQYNEDEDELRIVITPKMNEGLQDRLTYSIHDMKMDMGYIKLAWEKMRLYMRFKVDMMEDAMANLMNALEAAPEQRKWVVYMEGAQFMMDAEGNIDQALDWAKKSTEKMSNSRTWYVRAQAEAKKGEMAAAVASGTKAAELGLADERDNYYEDNKDEINAAIQGWAAKMN